MAISAQVCIELILSETATTDVAAVDELTIAVGLIINYSFSYDIML